MVPIPSWLTRTRESVTDDPQKFSTELSIIFKYSPFKTEAELMQQFDVIYGKCGKIITTLKFWCESICFQCLMKDYKYDFVFSSIYNITWSLIWGSYSFYLYKFCLRRVQTGIILKSLTLGERFVLVWAWWNWIRRGWYRLLPQGITVSAPDALLQHPRLDDARVYKRVSNL